MMNSTFSDPPDINGTYGEIPRQYSKLVQYSTLVIGIPVDVLGFVGNLLTIIVVVRSPVLWTPTNLFIISLSVSDLLYSCITLPVLLVTFYKSEWVFGDAFCQIHPLLMFTFVGATVLSLAGTAFGRFLKIGNSPLYGKLFTVKQRAAFMVLACWLLPFIFLLPPITGLWGELGYEPKTLTCTVLRGGSNSSFSMFCMLCYLIIPTSFIIFCYLGILRTVCKNHKKIHMMREQLVNEMSATTATENGSTPTTIQRQQQLRLNRCILREDLQYTKMMVCIFLVFIICYVPYSVATLIDPEVENMTFHFYCGMCIWWSCCLNPIVYVAMNRHFRKSLYRLIPMRGNGGRVADIVV